MVFVGLKNIIIQQCLTSDMIKMLIIEKYKHVEMTKCILKNDDGTFYHKIKRGWDKFFVSTSYLYIKITY